MNEFCAELIGTMILVLFGNGVVANVVLKGTKGNNGGWIVITLGWGFRRILRGDCCRSLFRRAFKSGGNNRAGHCRKICMDEGRLLHCCSNARRDYRSLTCMAFLPASLR